MGDKTRDEKILKNLEDDLGTSGQTTKAQDKEVLETVLKMMRDLAKDPKLDPHKTTRKTLRAKRLDPNTIDEIMKLKHIYEEVEDGKPVDIAHLRKELDEVINEMDQDVEMKKSQREIMESKDEVLHKKHDADMLKSLEDSPPQTGLTTEKQDYAIMYEVVEIMRDLAQDQGLDPERVSKYN